MPNISIISEMEFPVHFAYPSIHCLNFDNSHRAAISVVAGVPIQSSERTDIGLGICMTSSYDGVTYISILLSDIFWHGSVYM